MSWSSVVSYIFVNIVYFVFYGPENAVRKTTKRKRFSSSLLDIYLFISQMYSYKNISTRFIR